MLKCLNYCLLDFFFIIIYGFLIYTLTINVTPVYVYYMHHKEWKKLKIIERGKVFTYTPRTHIHSGYDW